MFISHHHHHQPFVDHVDLIGTLQKRRSSSLRHIRCEDDPNTCACALCTVHCAVHMQCVEHIAQMWVDGNFNWNSYNISVNSWCTPGNHSCCCGNCYKPKVHTKVTIFVNLFKYSQVSLFVTVSPHYFELNTCWTRTTLRTKVALQHSRIRWQFWFSPKTWDFSLDFFRLEKLNLLTTWDVMFPVCTDCECRCTRTSSTKRRTRARRRRKRRIKAGTN